MSDHEKRQLKKGWSDELIKRERNGKRNRRGTVNCQETTWKLWITWPWNIPSYSLVASGCKEKEQLKRGEYVAEVHQGSVEERWYSKEICKKKMLNSEKIPVKS